MQHMVVPDAHSKPGTSNARFEWLGYLALERRPEVIVDIGDWADMPSLCSYDVGKRSFEGRRYIKDIEAARDAREKFAKVLAEHNYRNSSDQYHPKMVALVGNHEARITRAVEDDAKLEGQMGLNDLGYADYGWEMVPFLVPKMINGICYSHYFMSGIMGRPIGGEHTAANILQKMHMSCICGHSHLRDFAERTRADGRRICSAVVGCYTEEKEPFTKGADRMWYRGVFFANHVHEGSYDPEWINIKEIKKRYA